MSLSDIIKIANVTGKRYAQGEVIFSSGDASDEGICIVLAGSVASQLGDQIRDQLFSRAYQTGEVFGLLALIGANRVETASALVDDTKILFINEHDFKRYLHQDEKFLANLFVLILARLESLPASQLRPPEEKLNLEDLLGEKAARMFEDTLQGNLRILEYLNKMHNKIILPNGVLFDEKDVENSSFYLLLEGEIEQFLKTNGDVLTPVNSIRPGQVFGFLRQSSKKGHALVARAGQRTAKVVVIDRDTLIKLTRIDSNIAMTIFQNMILMVALVEKKML